MILGLRSRFTNGEEAKTLLKRVAVNVHEVCMSDECVSTMCVQEVLRRVKSARWADRHVGSWVKHKCVCSGKPGDVEHMPEPGTCCFCQHKRRSEWGCLCLYFYMGLMCGCYWKEPSLRHSV